MLSCNNIVRRFGPKLALSGVSADLRPGIVGLLGANGAGKTTLLHILAGLDTPTAGTVTMEGKLVARHSELRKRVGICLAGAPPMNWLTGEQYLVTIARAYGVRHPNRRTAKLLEALGLNHAKDRAVATYSKGMTQRLKISAAVIHSPSTIILDEPFNGLDPAQRATVLALLRREVTNGAAVIVSSHMLGDLEGVCNEIIVMKSGHIVAQGSPSALRAAITAVPQEFVVTVNDPRTFAGYVLACEAVVGCDVPVDGAKELVVRCSHTVEFLTTLTRLVANADDDCGITRIQPMSGTIDDVYELLTEGRGIS